MATITPFCVVAPYIVPSWCDNAGPKHVDSAQSLGEFGCNSGVVDLASLDRFMMLIR